MSLRIYKYLTSFSWINNKAPLYKIWNRYEQTCPQITEETLGLLLKQRFPKAKDIQVKDTSGGCGQMFSILIESEEFRNLSVLKQHKMVYQTLDDQIKLMHGVHLITKAS